MKKIQLTKKQIKILMIVLFAIVIYFGLHTLCSNKLATIDIQKVVSSSKEVSLLKIENGKKLEELSKWLDGAKIEISAEKKKAKKVELTREYQEIARKRETEIKSNYNQQLAKISERIDGIIKKAAHKRGCSQVLVKGAVVMGGIDITNETIELIKQNEKR